MTPPMTSSAHTPVPTVPAADVQPNLFNPDDPSLDVPVPFTLTVRGRRLVDDVPALHVVADPTDDPIDDPGGPVAGDPDFVADLAHTDTWRQARVRALARAGRSAPDIAQESGLSESVVHLWLADHESPADAGPDGLSVGGDQARRRARPGSDEIADSRGRAILATCGTVEVGAVTATTSRIAVAAELLDWLRSCHDVADVGIRVVLRVADRATGDLVARAWADRLDLTPDRVSTVQWSRAPSPRAVQAMVRVTGRDLAADLAATLSRWPQA